MKLNGDGSAEVITSAVEHGQGTHTVLSQIAAQELGDSELFWRLCDANGALRPDELTAEPGRAIRITLPEGIPGASDGD